VRARVAIVYNEPVPSRYDAAGEKEAVLGVLSAVAAVHQALLELDYGVVRLGLVPPSGSAVRKLRSLGADVVFNLFEGFCGYPETEALVPETLAGLGIPYTGCPGEVLRLALDKAKVKVILKAAGIPTPDFQLLNPETLPGFHLGYPCIVKPRSEDASHGISEASVVDSPARLARQVRFISDTYGGGALVEEFIDGREFNVAVLGSGEGVVLPPSEIVYSLPPEMPRLLTFAAKWQEDSPYFEATKLVGPAEVDSGVQESISQTALTVFRLFGCRGYARVDVRMDGSERLNVIEVNPNPDISPGSGAARQAVAAGMSYAQFVEKVIQIALEKDGYEHQYPGHAEKRQARPDEDTAEYARIQTI